MNTTLEGKRHHSQLKQSEMKRLIKRACELNWEVTDYCKKRMLERIGKVVDNATLKRVISDGKLIEVSYKNGDTRILMRSNFVFRKNRQLVISFNITKGTVITVWDNLPSDTHRSCNWEMYNLA
jgi:hypothetical protein